MTNDIPVVFHIGSNCDYHLIIKELEIEFEEQFARFMASSLSNLFDNLLDGIHKIKCKDCDCFPEYESVKDNLIKYKCLSCNKDYSNKIDEELKKKRFKNTFNFCNNDISKSILLLRKSIYRY